MAEPNENQDPQKQNPRDNNEVQDNEDKNKQGEPKTGDNSNNSVDPEKVVEKLQGRIGKEQSEKHELADRLRKAEEQLNKLKKGSSVEKLSDADKNTQAQKENEDEIKKLKNQLKVANVTQQTNEVFKDAGLTVGSDVLKMVVSADDEQTYANAKALIGFANEISENARKSFLKGKTPTASGTPVKPVTATDFANMSFSDKMKLAKDNPEKFNELTGGK